MVKELLLRLLCLVVGKTYQTWNYVLKTALKMAIEQIIHVI